VFGGGAPWLTLQRALAESGPVNVVLSDRYPNVETLGGVCARSSGRLRLHVDAVDATEVPSELAGVRTLFNSLHHFTPEIATQILVDAVRQRRAVAFFEGVNHRGVGLLAVYLQLPAILLLTPFVRPFRWSRLLLTYAIPLIPLLILFDGTVSILRLYLEDELRELVAAVPGGEAFEWDVGAIGVGGSSIGLAYLIGVPRRGTHIGAPVRRDEGPDDQGGSEDPRLRTHTRGLRPLSSGTSAGVRRVCTSKSRRRRQIVPEGDDREASDRPGQAHLKMRLYEEHWARSEDRWLRCPYKQKGRVNTRPFFEG
jgi:hypothetical protein